MRGLGILLLLIGISEFVLPHLGREHVVFKLFGAYRMHGAIGFIAIGAVLVALSLRGGKKKDAKAA